MFVYESRRLGCAFSRNVKSPNAASARGVAGGLFSCGSGWHHLLKDSCDLRRHRHQQHFVRTDPRPCHTPCRPNVPASGSLGNSTRT